MDVIIETSQLSLPRWSHERLERRVQRALKRVTAKVKRLQVTLKDESGAKRGRGKVCTVHAKLAWGGEVFVTERSRSTARAFFRALRRSRTMVLRAAKRRNAFKTQALKEVFA